MRISVITPTYETEPYILARTWASLKRQTYTNWEWIVWDDSRTSLVERQIYGLAADERYTIRAFKAHTHCGIIGRVKRQAFRVADGDILVELDHDDELAPTALDDIVAAFDDESVGFVYSDWAEINAQGESCRYPEGWAFGYGSDYWDEAAGVWVMRAPDINATTMSHIVSAPNHVRAWRASAYALAGGHDATLRVADDYDLCVRTYLTTRMIRVPRLLYTQHIGETTAQRVHNAEIQERVAEISSKYSDAILERSRELAEDHRSVSGSER